MGVRDLSEPRCDLCEAPAGKHHDWCSSFRASSDADQDVASRSRSTRMPVVRPRAVVRHDPVLYSIGEIGVTEEHVITPNGVGPLRGSHWIMTDNSREVSRIPGYAIVLAVIFGLFFLVGLLFLLIREKSLDGHVDVTVRSGELYHVAQIPVSSFGDVDRVKTSVDHVRTLVSQMGKAAVAVEAQPESRRAMVAVEQPPLASREKTCPDCAEIIKAAARVCRYCGARFDAS